MKKIVLAIGFLLAFILVVASVSFGQTKMTASKDTLNNADTASHVIDLGGQLNNFSLLTVQVVGTKSSGTVAGNAVVYGSLDGTNYKAIGSDTLTLTNGNNFHLWEFSNTRYRYYKVVVITSNTQKSYYACKVFGRKQPNIGN